MALLEKIIRKVSDARALLRGTSVPDRCEEPLAHPPGHFYSPVPSLEEAKRDEERIWGVQELDGIDLNEEEQRGLLDVFKELYREIPFTPQRNGALRYCFENPNYSYSDGIFSYCMIRKARPKRIVEVGSGYSTCLILDTKELFFDDLIDLVCIEPYPRLLESLLRDGDNAKFTLVPKRLQDVPLEVFRGLGEGDILFIDSTHVSKLGSDVNHLFSRVLPNLARGVYIHFHDIYYPFEYPKWMFFNYGITWNEAYILRAFLQFNESFKITAFNTYLTEKCRDFFEEHMPLCLKNPGGSIWLRRV